MWRKLLVKKLKFHVNNTPTKIPLTKYLKLEVRNDEYIYIFGIYLKLKYTLQEQIKIFLIGKRVYFANQHGTKVGEKKIEVGRESLYQIFKLSKK